MLAIPAVLCALQRRVERAEDAQQELERFWCPQHLSLPRLALGKVSVCSGRTLPAPGLGLGDRSTAPGFLTLWALRGQGWEEMSWFVLSSLVRLGWVLSALSLLLLSTALPGNFKPVPLFPGGSWCVRSVSGVSPRHSPAVWPNRSGWGTAEHISAL